MVPACAGAGARAPRATRDRQAAADVVALSARAWPADGV